MTRLIDLSKYTSIGVGPKVEVELIDSPKWDKEGYAIIGGGNNLLISPTPPPLAMLSKSYEYIRIEEESLIIGGATRTGKILSYMKKHNIGGFEFLPKLPGLLGGLVKMNAGLKEDEIFNHLLAVTTTKGHFTKAQIPHGYRHTEIEGVVLEARFSLQKGFSLNALERFKRMRDNQPSEPSAGSCFSNPEGHFAGALIEAVGLRGKRIGSMAFSEKHANFLINLGGGSFSEAMELINLAKMKVYAEKGITLKEEIVIL